jgi:hypothetical protein
MVTLEATPLAVNVVVGSTKAHPMLWHQVPLQEPHPYHYPYHYPNLYPTLTLTLALSINQNLLLNNAALRSFTEPIPCYSTATSLLADGDHTTEAIYDNHITDDNRPQVANTNTTI